MSKLAAELRAIHDELLSMIRALENPALLKPLESLQDSAEEVGKASGHSWFGYQSLIYYEGLKPPPPGLHPVPLR